MTTWWMNSGADFANYPRNWIPKRKLSETNAARSTNWNASELSSYRLDSSWAARKLHPLFWRRLLSSAALYVASPLKKCLRERQRVAYFAGLPTSIAIGCSLAEPRRYRKILIRELMMLLQH